LSRRERLRENTIAEIKQIARRQMAENGTAAVSLNAIARELEVSTPALYRYFSSRDDLVTALIADAYYDLAAAMETASQSLPQQDYRGRLMATVLAYRAWALAHPVDFELIYGNPIPGYHAPEAITTPAARQGFAVILGILYQALQAGQLRPLPEYAQVPGDVDLLLPELPGDQSDPLPGIVLYLGVVGWARVHGLIMLELFHHSQGVVGDTATLYSHEMENLLSSIGLKLEMPQAG
jgi:AcrR family transcriptional regulator